MSFASCLTLSNESDRPARILDAIDKGSSAGGSKGRFWTIVSSYSTCAPVCMTLMTRRTLVRGPLATACCVLIICSGRHVGFHPSPAIRRLSRSDRGRASGAGCDWMPQSRSRAREDWRGGHPQRQGCIDGRCQGRGILLRESLCALVFRPTQAHGLAPTRLGAVHQARLAAHTTRFQPVDFPRVGRGRAFGARHPGQNRGDLGRQATEFEDGQSGQIRLSSTRRGWCLVSPPVPVVPQLTGGNETWITR